VTLAPVDLLARIVTARAAGLGGLDALAVDDRGRGAGVAPDPFAICHHKRGLSVQSTRRRARQRTSGRSSPISRIGHSRDWPAAQGFGKCGAMTRHSVSVKSVWYRVTVRLCFCRVVGVHMANPSWFKKPLGITVGANDSTFFENCC
jgi:hypothetical protein